MNRKKIIWLVVLGATTCVLVISHFSAVHAVARTRTRLNGRNVIDVAGLEIQKRQEHVPSSHQVNNFENFVLTETNPAGHGQ